MADDSPKYTRLHTVKSELLSYPVQRGNLLPRQEDSTKWRKGVALSIRKIQVPPVLQVELIASKLTDW